MYPETTWTTPVREAARGGANRPRLSDARVFFGARFAVAGATVRRVGLGLGTRGLTGVAAVHERLQFWTGAFGQLSLLPVLAVGALAGLITLRRLRWHRLGQALLVAGAAAWLVTQLVDAVQSSGRLDGLSVPEEMLEMGGSACFCLAILTALRAGRRRSSAASGEPSPARAAQAG